MTAAARSSVYREWSHSMDNKSYRCWRRLMVLGAGMGCHQKPDRSFFIGSYQMPVCARCTGVIIGYLAAIPIYVIKGFQLELSLIGCLIILSDWLLQQLRVLESTNLRRMITGCMGGYGVMSLQLYILTGILFKLL